MEPNKHPLSTLTKLWWLISFLIFIVIVQSVLLIWQFFGHNNKEPHHPASIQPQTVNFEHLDLNAASDKTLKTAVHEAGHAVVALSFNKIIEAIDIVPLNSMIDGATAYYRKDDHNMEEKDYLDEITINCSGRAAEILLFQTDGGKRNYLDDENAAKTEINNLFHKFPQNTYLTNRQGNRLQATQDILNACYHESKKRLIEHKLIWKIIIQMLLYKKSVNCEGDLLNQKMSALKLISPYSVW